VSHAYRASFHIGFDIDVPAEALGGMIRLKLRLLSQYHDPSIVLTGCNIEAMVE